MGGPSAAVRGASAGAPGSPPAIGLLTAERGELGVNRSPRALEQDVQLVIDEVHGARHELRAVQLDPPRGADHDGPPHSRQRVQPQRETLGPAEPSARAAEELAKVIAGNVLDDLPARVGAQPVAEHDGHAEDQIAHRAKAMAQRAREVLEQTLPERRVPGWVEREPLTLLGQQRLKLADAHPGRHDGRQIARLILDDSLRSAQRGQPAREDGRDRGPGPRRTVAAWGTPCRDSQGRAGQTRIAAAPSRRGPLR